MMGRLIYLTTIGLVGGCILAGCLFLIHIFTGNDAYLLLFDVDYIPLINTIWSQPGIGLVFHFVFCVLSVVVLFYMLKWWGFEQKGLIYMGVYTLGSAGLFFLTSFSSIAPAANDWIAWFYWTASHFVYGMVVGLLIRRVTYVK